MLILSTVLIQEGGLKAGDCQRYMHFKIKEIGNYPSHISITQTKLIQHVQQVSLQTKTPVSRRDLFLEVPNVDKAL